MKINFIIVSVFCLVMSGCGFFSTQSPPAALSAQANYFDKMEGCFLLFNLKTESFDKIIGEENCKKQYPAASTFKVPLAVMAFDSKVLKNEKVIFKWDGKKEERAESNKNHDARSWMRESIVWFSQRLTPKIGIQRLQKYLDEFQYGNRDLSAGLQDAWLQSPGQNGPALKISAYEQAEFMKKLWTNSLPASKRAMQLTQDIMYLETSAGGFKMHGKTGSNFFDTERKVHLGWFISHIQKGEQQYITVANFRDLMPNESPGYGGLRAKEITKKILTDAGLW